MFACEKVPYSYEAGLFYSGGRISNQDECDQISFESESSDLSAARINGE